MAVERVPGVAGAEGAAHSAARSAAPWVEMLARLGFAAKGAVYIMMGLIAASAAFTGGGRTAGSSGALATLADSTWGRLALGLIAVGLAGYVLWRALSAALNPEHEKSGKRAFYAVTAVVYAGLALEAGRLAMGQIGRGDDGASHWSAELMSQPFGQLLMGLAGLGVLVYGLQQIWHGWRVDLDERLDMSAMSRSARAWTIGLGRFGLAARGVVFTIIGGFFLVAAIQSDPSEALGIGGALGMMRQIPWLLGIVALGLVAYGLYQMVRARHRRIRAA